MNPGRRKTQLLSLGWVLVSLIHATKFSMAMQTGPLLEKYHVHPDPTWLTWNSGLMLMLALVALFSLLQHWKGSGTINRIIALLMAADNWLVRLLFWQSPSTSNTLFALGLTVVLIGGVFWLTKGSHERKRSGN
jgi:uncharacterized membrane protein